MPNGQEITTIDAQIKELTNDLAGLELDGIERSNHKLITSAKEPCLAVFYDRGELLVASNYEEPRYAKHYLTQNYEKLVLLTSGQIKSLIKNESMDEELERPKRKKKETKKLALEQFENYLLTKEALKVDQIQKLAEKVLAELLNSENTAYSGTERHDN
ncbi:2407_t:CDS:2 [Gigaspora margarita]|uniref:2407_t:CDS:1 n=1 Tax=Gigaspora margarita TaxID=4874 RepID=A0ABN7UVE6_GIGMA|nr:2407_t:CDS:2 [Gigaspora margarita]